MLTRGSRLAPRDPYKGYSVSLFCFRHTLDSGWIGKLNDQINDGALFEIRGHDTGAMDFDLPGNLWRPVSHHPAVGPALYNYTIVADQPRKTR